MRSITEQYDVVVSGGGLAGVCAAIASARNGASTVLIEERAVLGGNSSSLAGVPPHGATALGHNRNARESGILEELRMAYFGTCTESDNRQYWDLILAQWCAKEPNLVVHMNTKVIGTQTTAHRIRSIEAIQGTTETFYRIEGNLFIDATGNAVIAMEAGAPVRMGREGHAEFGEIYAPKEPDTKTMGATIYLIAFKRNYPVQFSPPPGARMYQKCSDLKNRPHELRTILPVNSLALDDSTVRIFWWIELGGERHIIHDNESIYEELLSELMGVWDHLKNRCTKETREALTNYDLVWWSTIPLRRESRRVVGEYMMTEDDIFHPKLFPDRISYGGFPIDLHPPEGIHSPEAPCLQIFLNDLYPIPYRVLIPQKVENLLLAGRAVSASHVALGSLRVMFTLGALGQAAGTAAAICIKYRLLPRDLCTDPGLQKLQIQLLKDDCYIPGLPNIDPEDLAREAEIVAFSQLELRSEETNGFFELYYPTIQQIPFPGGRLDIVEIYLKSDSPSEELLYWKILSGRKLGDLPERKPIAEGVLRIPPNIEGWFPLNVSIDHLDVTILSIWIEAKPRIYWGFSRKECFGTRCGVFYSGSLDVGAFHGDARIAPLKSSWIFINHHGRIPSHLKEELEKRTQDSLYNNSIPLNKPLFTLNFRTTPSFSPYGAGNLTNGYGRAVDFPNIWISDPSQGFPQAVTLHWAKPKTISRIILIFDTNLDLEDRFYGFPREKFRFSVPVPECVKDYRIDALYGSVSQVIAVVNGNIWRRREHVLDNPILADLLRITIFSSNGADTARMYEIRVY